MAKDKKIKHFRIERSGSPHHYMDFDVDWMVYDNYTNKVIKTFTGDAREDTDIQYAEFSKDGKEVLAKDENDKIVERFQLPQ